MMIILSFIKSGKIKDSVESYDIYSIEKELIKSRFGFNWWYWIPKIKLFRGLTIIEIFWLCFNFEISKH